MAVVPKGVVGPAASWEVLGPGKGSRLPSGSIVKASVEGVGGMDWGFGIGICTLRYADQSANGELLYSTGNSTQCSVIIYVGKESERDECVNMYESITLSYGRNYHRL